MKLLKIELTQREFHEIAKSTRKTEKGENFLHLMGGSISNYPLHSFEVKFDIEPFNTKIICKSDDGSYHTELVTVDAFSEDDFKLVARTFVPNLFGDLKIN